MALQQKYNESLLEGNHNYETLTENVSSVILKPECHGNRWAYIIAGGFIMANVLLCSIGYLIYEGIGIWGNNQPVAWSFDIINFVWWIGIGHAGTLISAILLLLRQQWRNSINRFAEAMTIFAVMCAGIYPMLHTGRPWCDYWLFPYPNILGMWPQFRSPLVWDVFAVSTYFTISLLYWYLGLIPDFATLRDRTTSKVARKTYAILCMGWRGSTQHWQRYEAVYLILAGISTPLVLSVHSIVSFDFAVGIVPGWHVTIFPPYFVAGAVYAGFAMVLLFALPVRAWYNLKDLITERHIDWMCKIMLTTGMIVFYGYIMEFFYAWYSGEIYELYLTHNRLFGPYSWAYYSLLFCNGVAPQILWSRKIRHHIPTVFGVCIIVSIGMWLERFIIIPVSLHRDYLPSSWGMYYPTFWDLAMFAGTIGFFVFCMFMFIRFMPIINIFEVKDLFYHKKGHEKKKTQVLTGSDKDGGHN